MTSFKSISKTLARRIASHRVGALPVCVGVLACTQSHVQETWSHLASGSEHTSIASSLPQSIDPPTWRRSTTSTQLPIWYIGQAGVVADSRHVFSLAEIDTQYKLLAMHRDTGETDWTAPIPAPYFDSWSTPTIDTENATVIVASGSELAAFDTLTGDRIWTSTLANSIVNASPTLTTDLGLADRVFITDYDGFGASASLYCINIDPHHPTLNPFEPGDVVWSVRIGQSSGNTPAYHDGIVYTASAGNGVSPNGQLFAFPADSMTPPLPLWSFTNPKPKPFVGGVCIHTINSQTNIYAASYSFSGGFDSANLVKVDASTGNLRWTVDTNRTASIPVPLENGHILLAGGIVGFGSMPSLELITDLGTSASHEWNSATDTWNDLNANGFMDPGEFLLVGGWSTQPVATESNQILVGAIPISGFLFEPCTDLFILDANTQPTDPLFVLDSFEGAGSTAAVAGNTIFSVGQDGLHAFDFAPACYADCDTSTGTGILDIFDFLCFQSAFVTLDPYACDCDTTTGIGICDIFDFLCFQSHFVSGCP